MLFLYRAKPVSHFQLRANSVHCCMNINENANSHSEQMTNKWYQRRHLRESNLLLVIAAGVLQPSVLIGSECLVMLHQLALNLTGTFVSTPIRMPACSLFLVRSQSLGSGCSFEGKWQSLCPWTPGLLFAVERKAEPFWETTQTLVSLWIIYQAV